MSKGKIQILPAFHGQINEFVVVSCPSTESCESEEFSMAGLDGLKIGMISLGLGAGTLIDHYWVTHTGKKRSRPAGKKIP